MLKLDDRDIQILSILRKEGRITNLALSEKVNLSPTPCWARLKRLEKVGLITHYSAHIAWHNFGRFSTIFTQVELSSHRSEDFAAFENAIEKIDAVLECWSVGGGTDYVMKVIADDIDDYQRMIDDLLNANLSIKRYYSYIVTKRVKETQAIPKCFLPEPAKK